MDAGEVGEGIGCEPSVGGGPLAGGIGEVEALGGGTTYGKSVGEPPCEDCEGRAGGGWKINKDINVARLDISTHILMCIRARRMFCCRTTGCVIWRLKLYGSRNCRGRARRRCGRKTGSCGVVWCGDILRKVIWCSSRQVGRC